MLKTLVNYGDLMKTNKKMKFYKICGFVVAVLSVLCVVVLWQGLTVHLYTETTDKVEKTIRIAVLTDLHDTFYGKKQKRLIKSIQKQKPDIVVLVGDIADDNRSHDGTEQLLSAIGKQYPCYYVSGNHEYLSGKIDEIKEMIRSCGVTVLEGNAEILNVNGQKIRLCGVDDLYRFIYKYSNSDRSGSWQEQLDACKAETGDDVYSVLLSHRPELAEKYRNSGFDLVIAGHAHGGQVRIPWLLKGLIAPNQGWFPKYTSGIYVLGTTDMLVSRGLCKNKRPRVFNPPELVVVDIEPQK
ncbi:hypothetical protein SDC9_142473 [bioreactor metagenome]|uniref:Calcineurin-like phosphoesterase domain-containing protein n=1 Tax=bioreactor metagenome TaxID=1076179 RepID=A0A645E195_9ZZZZ